MGLAVLDAGRESGRVGSGGTSSGEASKRATKSLNDAFLDLKPLGGPIPGCGLTPVRALLGCVCVFKDNFRPPGAFFPVRPLPSSAGELDLREVPGFSASGSIWAARNASWCSATGDLFVNGS
jgi:hypothetical protein